MKKILTILLFFCGSHSGYTQQAEKPVEIYHPELDAKKQMIDAVAQANLNNKHVLLMVGGNWCKWCRMFEKFLHADAQLDSTVSANFVFEHINFSKENKNEELLKELEFPQRFGFPVFVILDSNGKRIHTQNSGYLEQGEGYSKEKVIEFFNQWSVSALKEENYKK
jgi:thioredoxin-related protein